MRPSVCRRATVTNVLRLLRQPRWIALLVLVLVLVPSFVRLGSWQFNKYERRSAQADAIEANTQRDPAPVDDLLAVGTELPDAAEWTPLVAEGRYDADEQLLVRYKSLEGQQGFHVLVPLVTGDGTALLVDRGFVPRELNTPVPSPPSPPSSEVTITGRARQSESGRGTGDDEQTGTIRFIDVDALADDLPYPVYGAWVELLTEDPPAADPPQQIPEPDPGTGPHLIYAVQWWLFAAIAPVGFFLLLRNEARLPRDQQPDEQLESGAPPTPRR